ncbi:MAG: TraR/DksA C4-type zinc finger protein, partial [Betaproteobacteria bacterium]|nr:TraR/DksA C4-type zinc finger protein [Betaproteobacteria bacterium]
MPLTREQSIELGAVIGERRNALLQEIREDVARAREHSFGELAGPAPDPGDQSVADLIADLEQADVGRDLDELRALEAAHARFREGRYGICVDCGADIEYARLRANPSAIRCIHCQRV